MCCRCYFLKTSLLLKTSNSTHCSNLFIIINQHNSKISWSLGSLVVCVKPAEDKGRMFTNEPHVGDLSLFLCHQMFSFGGRDRQWHLTCVFIGQSSRWSCSVCRHCRWCHFTKVERWKLNPTFQCFGRVCWTFCFHLQAWRAAKIFC